MTDYAGVGTSVPERISDPPAACAVALAPWVDPVLRVAAA